MTDENNIRAVQIAIRFLTERKSVLDRANRRKSDYSPKEDNFFDDGSKYIYRADEEQNISGRYRNN
ncbi:MAG: hypothetical protein AABY02_03735 [Nanoarchaeota archaeon]